MTAILVVDDVAEKRDRIVSVIQSAAADFGGAALDTAADRYTAIELLQKVHYDLVVLDLAIPVRKDRPVDRNGGVELLRELEGPRPLKRPTHVVGLTAHEDLFQTTIGEFAGRLMALLKFDPAEDEWVDRLQILVRHVCRSSLDSQVDHGTYNSLIGIVCALHSPELRAVRDITEWGLKQERVDGDHTSYFIGEVPEAPRGERRVVAAAAPYVGIAASAVLATKLIKEFRPRYIAMVGIAAGVDREEVSFGDVLVPNPCWEWASGKLVDVGGRSSFSAAPYQLSLAPELQSRLTSLSDDGPELEKIRAAWRGADIKTPLRVHVGPMATGPSVVADTKVVKEIRAQHRKLIGIDMEAYAIFSAAREAPLPKPSAFVLKSVVDYADRTKSDDYHGYAAYTSSRTLKLFVERYLAAAGVGEPLD